MAETLGSLVDKLTIKEIREFHINEMIRAHDVKFSRSQLVSKLKVLHKQKDGLIGEINCLLAQALKTGTAVRDEKLKLYNAVTDIGRIPPTHSLGEAISGLAGKNLELWHLEDEARRKDVTLAYIGGIKKKIDLANQQRNDYIDKIDELFNGSISHSCKKIN